MGVFLGSATLGLVCLVLASFFHFSTLTISLSTLVLLFPLILLRDASIRARFRTDILKTAGLLKQTISLRDYQSLFYLLCYLGAAFFFWRFFRTALYETPDGLFTGVDNNYFDLPVHLGIISGFVSGDNFPPIHPEYAGARLAYPFLIDFLAAMLVRAGMSLPGALLLQNLIFALAMVGVIHRWALKLTRSAGAAMLSLVLLLINGGWGWWIFAWQVWRRGLNRLGTLLADLPHNYTVLWGEDWGQVLRFGNSLTTLFLPQRSFLLGLPLFLIVSTLWWQAMPDEAEGEDRYHDSEKMRLMLAAGAIAGLLPLAHAHSFIVLMGVGACLALLFRRWRLWSAFFIVAVLMALPQIIWATHGSSVQARSFIQWHLGWIKGDENFFVFWFKNTGLFIPLLFITLWAGYGRFISRKLLFFYLPFVFCFIGPNLLKLAPWEFDNIKVFFYWYVASVPLVALLLTRLLRCRSYVVRILAVSLILLLTVAGVLDIWRVLAGKQEWQEYDRDGLALAALIRERTPPRALILNAPIHNHPVLLTGRRSTLGFAKTVWTHGIDVEEREFQVSSIYRGERSEEFINRLGVDYIVVGPAERDAFPDLNESVFNCYKVIGEAGGSRLYQVSSP